jgi:predicted Zn-dependent peptidase
MSSSLTRNRHHLQVHRTVLANGLTVLTVENPTADIVSGRIFIRVGTRYEAIAQAGITHLLMSVLTRGTERLSSMEIAEQIESVGAALGTDSATDYSLVSLKTVASDFADMLGLTAEIMRSPAFPDHEVELERRLTLQGLRSMQEQPFSIAQRQLRQTMYGEHPYALSALGTEDSVPQLTAADLAAHHQTYFRPDNVVISIVGRITPERAIALVESTFGDWQNPDTTPLTPPLLPDLTPQPQRVLTEQDTQQAILILGYLAPPIGSPDYVTLRLINTHLGNGLSSRLFVELREKQGLAYDVSTVFPTRVLSSQFLAYMGTAPMNVAIALTGLRQEVERLCTTPLTAEELQVAKSKYLGQYALGKQTNAQIAQIYGWYETLGVGVNYDDQFQQEFAAITAEDVQAAAKRYFTEPYISLVGPQAAIGVA